MRLQRMPSIGRSAIAGLVVVALAVNAGAHGPPGVSAVHIDGQLRLQPKNVTLLLQRADLLRLDGRLDAARVVLDVAESFDPTAADVDLYRARLHLDGGRPGAALADLESFLTRAPAHELSALALTLAAEALVELQRPQEAEAAFDGAIATAPRTSPELFLARAGLLRGRVVADCGDDVRCLACVLQRANLGMSDGRRLLGPVASLEREASLIAGMLEGLPAASSCPAEFDHIPAWLRSPAPPLSAPPVTAATSSLSVRGPYLQLGGPDRATIRWRSNVATDSWVGWGASPGVYTWSTTIASATTEHEVPLQWLTPATTYYYACGSSPADVVAGADSYHFFTTAPTPGTDAATRLWVIGDSGTGNADAAAVRDGFLSFTGSTHPDGWLMLGDNAYTTGTDAEYQTAVFDLYSSLLRNTFLWPVIGNHDAASADSPTQTGPYFSNFSLPTAGEIGGSPSGTEAYYSFDWANLHFVCLDSSDSSMANGSAMLQWLQADLESTGQDWTVATFHHPPYTRGSHNSDIQADSGGRMFLVRQNVLPILEGFGVDLVLSGHSHAYERSFQLDGHYGTSDSLDPVTMVLDGGDGRVGGDGAYEKVDKANGGAVYVVAGSSGKISGGTLDHPVMFLSLNQLGSLVLDITPDTLTGTFVGTAGTAEDWFMLAKPHVTADFRFQGHLESARVGAPALTAPGGVAYSSAVINGRQCEVATFAAGAGLRLDTSWLPFSVRDEHSIALLFELDEVSSWRKLVDTANLSSDFGLYVHDTALRHDPGGGPGGVVTATSWVQVVYTRSADGTVTGWVDGVFAFSGNDSGMTAITVDGLLNFFVDDNVSSTDSSAGSVARIRLFDRALTAAEVTALDLMAPGQCFEVEIFSDDLESGSLSNWSAVIP